MARAVGAHTSCKRSGAQGPDLASSEISQHQHRNKVMAPRSAIAALVCTLVVRSQLLSPPVCAENVSASALLCCKSEDGGEFTSTAICNSKFAPQSMLHRPRTTLLARSRRYRRMDECAMMSSKKGRMFARTVQQLDGIVEYMDERLLGTNEYWTKILSEIPMSFLSKIIS